MKSDLHFEDSTRFTEVYKGPAGQIWQKPLLSTAETDVLLNYLKHTEAEQFEGEDVFTHGHPLYRGSKSDDAFQLYIADAEKFRTDRLPILSWLYTRLQDELTGFLGAPTVLHPELAPPGFIVYRGNRLHMSRPHYDFQARRIPAIYTENRDQNRIITFTLPLALPKAGSGLYFWTPTFKEFIDKLRPDPNLETLDLQLASSWGFDPRDEGDMKVFSFLSTQTRQHCSYSVGTLNLMIGALLHHGGPMNNLTGGESRITLQGHGLYHNDGYWEIYW